MSRSLINGPGWVFGYGSLIWRQDFPFLEARPAHVQGWVRRFWQGSHDHRGIPEAPGRVLTLVESPGEICRGRAFLVDPEVLAHLDYREKNGYHRRHLQVHVGTETVTGLTYVARPDNPAFLGDAPLEDMVEQIRLSRGESGTNTDYVLGLARELRRMGIHDAHVFRLEALLLRDSA
ncbi:MAG: gamma-glutamylcyclotransferase [Gammaproteobacteria bacterium]